ncbi:MAG: VOC family protein [Chloroflexota bacterium]
MMLKPRETVIFAENFQALVDWYVRVLDFKVSRLVEDDYHYCNLENEAGIQIGIADAEEMGIKPIDRKHNTVVLQFQVDDVQALFDHLVVQGGQVAFGPSFDKEYEFWFGGFQDLEGNTIWVVDENCP